MNINFPEKYNFKEIENKWKDCWEKEKIYEFKYNKNKPFYVVDTPPPYISNDHLHAGHLMSYGQAEFVVRYKRMTGDNIFYPMGFDDNGLPTERYVEKKYNIKDKKDIKKSEFIALCLKETKLGIKNYKKLWQKMGISVDWSKNYSTINPLTTKVSQRSLIDLYKKDYLYKKEMPTLYCPLCQTAISQADLEDQEEDTYMNHIIFYTENKEKLIIATTRPELIPACVSLYINPNDERYKHLHNQFAITPILNHKIPIKTSEKVDMEKGTGLMMVCTWGDQEDIDKWINDKLDTKAIFATDGKLNEKAGKYKGLDIVLAKEKILIDLQKENLLIKQEKITHMVNVHERCNTKAEFIMSEQWFIKIVDNKDIWHKMGDKINWYPKKFKKHYDIWVDSLKWDWCISRQRYYGVPFPFWYCKNCNEIILPDEKDLPVNPFEEKPNIDKCPKCNFQEFAPEESIMDTWATSSCTPFLVKELWENNDNHKLFPVNLRPNAKDIIRTWDFYSIVKAYYNFNSIPFKDVMVSGTGVDTNGNKISKRLGNFIPAIELIEKYGADAIRFWSTSANLGSDLRFSEEKIQMGNKTCVKLFNVGKFLSLNINDIKNFNIPDKFEDEDIWIINNLNEVIKKSTQSFEKYEFSNAKKEIDFLFWNYFTDYYLEFIKYRIFKSEYKEKKYSAIYTLYIVFLNILKLYAPFMPFITEELYQIFYKDFENKKSIHISSWPKNIDIKMNDYNEKEFEKAILAIDEIRKYKSQNNISLGKELDTYKLNQKVDLDKYKDFICNVIKVKRLI